MMVFFKFIASLQLPRCWSSLSSAGYSTWEECVLGQSSASSQHIIARPTETNYSERSKPHVSRKGSRRKYMVPESAKSQSKTSPKRDSIRDKNMLCFGCGLLGHSGSECTSTSGLMAHGASKQRKGQRQAKTNESKKSLHLQCEGKLSVSALCCLLVAERRDVM